MITIIYILIFLILIFVAFTGFKAASTGIEAKQRNKFNKEKRGTKKNISKDLSRLDKLYKTRGITKKEFEKAKNKILNN